MSHPSGEINRFKALGGVPNRPGHLGRRLRAARSLLDACYPAVVAYSPEAMALLEAQRAYFASDEHIQERAAMWRDATPEECLEALEDCCREAEYFLSLQSPEALERILAPQPLPTDTLAILEALQR